jgi:CRP/FNR family transcriptional regulator
MMSDSGNEVVLYRVEEGQSCILTTACLVAHEQYHAEGITETEVTAVTMPASAFQKALAMSEGFRTFVFSSYGRRLTDLFMLIDAISFARMDTRLAGTLRSMGDKNREIHITHYDLARELGTAREVISRLLKDFERRDWIHLRRGVITVTAPEALSNFASKNNPM